MSEFSIRVEKLSKLYRIKPTMGAGWRRNQRVLTEEISRIMKFSARVTERKHNTSFWALKDITFKLEQGGIVGIIGPNGAGKSTLLKILSRVTEPTSGRAEIYGRVGSLLEVGTGFHSELTGRENIFISGAILGMTRAEIKSKFDEIVEFSGVQQFLETPVKRFSSGMEVRLAFSVAVHLNPEILLVDEVLSVGDAAFRKKSLNKIHEVSQQGGAVLFVSHNMSTVASLCSHAMVLDQGMLSLPISPVAETISHYSALVQQGFDEQLEKKRRGMQSDSARIIGFSILDGNQQNIEGLTSDSPIELHVEYEVLDKVLGENINLSILVKTLDGNIITNLDSRGSKRGLKFLDGKGTVICKIKKLPLLPGNVSISLILRLDDRVVDLLENVYVGSVRVSKYLEASVKANNAGWVHFEHEWFP